MNKRNNLWPLNLIKPYINRSLKKKLDSNKIIRESERIWLFDHASAQRVQNPIYTENEMPSEIWAVWFTDS